MLYKCLELTPSVLSSRVGVGTGIDPRRIPISDLSASANKIGRLETLSRYVTTPGATVFFPLQLSARKRRKYHRRLCCRHGSTLAILFSRKILAGEQHARPPTIHAPTLELVW